MQPGDPNYDAYLPYSDRLFFLYLLVLSVVLLVQVIRVVRELLALGTKFHNAAHNESANREFDYLWQMCSARVRSIKQKIPLTLIVSGMISVWDISEIVSEYKWIGTGAFSGGIAGALMQLVRGVGAAAILYFIASQFELALLRRRLKWEYEQTKPLS